MRIALCEDIWSDNILLPVNQGKVWTLHLAKTIQNSQAAAEIKLTSVKWDQLKEEWGFGAENQDAAQ